MGNDLFNNVTALLSFLFERELMHLNTRQSQVLVQHAAKGGSKDGFRHMGMIYTTLAGEARKRGSYDRLVPALVPEMGSILTSRKVIENDQARIKQALTLVLRDAHSPQDMRDALPNCLQDLIP